MQTTINNGLHSKANEQINFNKSILFHSTPVHAQYKLRYGMENIDYTVYKLGLEAVVRCDHMNLGRWVVN